MCFRPAWPFSTRFIGGVGGRAAQNFGTRGQGAKGPTTKNKQASLPTASNFTYNAYTLYPMVLGSLGTIPGVKAQDPGPLQLTCRALIPITRPPSGPFPRFLIKLPNTRKGALLMPRLLGILVMKIPQVWHGCRASGNRCSSQGTCRRVNQTRHTALQSQSREAESRHSSAVEA